MQLDYSGKVVLVTGGTKGIGRTITNAFIGLGATVVACSRSSPGPWDGVAPDLVACNVRDPEQVAAMFEGISARHGRLDVLVNNAGGSPQVDAATAAPRLHSAIVDLNLLAPLTVSQHANAMMQSQPGGGVIVNIASVSGVRPSPGTAAYGAAKAGLLSLTRSLAVEWAPKVRLVAVVAGLIETELAEMHYGDAAGVARVAATVPLGRMGTPDDVANACVWLASPYAAYASGAALHLDGGGEEPAFLKAARGD